jgi:integrase
MPRPRKDGTGAVAPNRRKLSEIYVRNLKPRERAFCTWDTHQRGLCVLTQPSGYSSWKCVYHYNGRPRWYHIGAVAAIGLADARKLASKIMFEVASGRDPLAERQAERSKGTFAELSTRYLEEHAKKTNRSWPQAAALVERNLLPYWGALQAADVSRSDVRTMMARVEAPVVANQTLAAASAIFSWAMREDLLAVNPCAKIERNATSSRERILSDTEVPLFMSALDHADQRAAALQFILLTGQRPGEVAHLRREHIVDGWWQMPGEPVPGIGWPGTKNGASHRVWLPQAARDLLGDGGKTGFVFSTSRGRAAVNGLAKAMRLLCKRLGVERATPHDLRRTFSTVVTRLGFGREAMNRVTNHKEGGIASVYDRHQYAEENKRVMEAVAAHILALAEGGADDDSNVVRLEQRR